METDRWEECVYSRRGKVALGTFRYTDSGFFRVFLDDFNRVPLKEFWPSESESERERKGVNLV